MSFRRAFEDKTRREIGRHEEGKTSERGGLQARKTGRQQARKTTRLREQDRDATKRGGQEDQDRASFSKGEGLGLLLLYDQYNRGAAVISQSPIHPSLHLFIHPPLLRPFPHPSIQPSIPQSIAIPLSNHPSIDPHPPIDVFPKTSAMLELGRGLCNNSFYHYCGQQQQHWR